MFIKSVTLFLIGFAVIETLADVSELGNPNPNIPVNPVTDICLGCICEASSDCNRELNCDGTVCGLFRITWAYWSDAGKPTQNGQSPESQTAYPDCVNEPFCAARTVQNYMARYGQDCNNDGIVDCKDFAAIHKMGAYGCAQPVPEWYKAKFDRCLSIAQQFTK